MKGKCEVFNKGYCLGCIGLAQDNIDELKQLCEIYKEEIGNAFKIERLIKELRLEEPTVPPEVDVPPVTPDIDDSQKRSFAPQR